MINENTQLGYVVSLLRGFGRYFYAEDERSIFDLRIFIARNEPALLHRFYTEIDNKVQFIRSKIDFLSSA